FKDEQTLMLSDSLIREARRAAAARGANILFSTDSSGSQRRQMTFEAYRMEYEDVVVPPAFLKILPTTAFRDDAYLRSLIAEWEQKGKGPYTEGPVFGPAPAPAAVPTSAAAPPSVPE